MQTVQTKCNVFEVAAVGLYSSLKMRKHLPAKVKVKMGLPCMFTQFSLCPAHSFFAQGLVIAKSIKYPLRNSRIVRYNSGIGGQSRNSQIAAGTIPELYRFSLCAEHIYLVRYHNHCMGLTTEGFTFGLHYS